jgi:hypothetical protein
MKSAFLILHENKPKTVFFSDKQINCIIKAMHAYTDQFLKDTELPALSRELDEILSMPRDRSTLLFNQLKK